MKNAISLKNSIVISVATFVYEVADGVTAGLGWGLALSVGALTADEVQDRRQLVASLKREGNVIYLPRSK